jgi:hypothetical protein
VFYRKVGEINDELDKLTSAQDKRERLNVIGHLLQHCDADEHYWLARIIVKDLKIGLSHTPILKAFHKDAVRLSLSFVSSCASMYLCIIYVSLYPLGKWSKLCVIYDVLQL